jgi:hypothetical protein
MAYGELRFDDEEDKYTDPCDYCGRRRGHTRDCIYSEIQEDEEEYQR